VKIDSRLAALACGNFALGTASMSIVGLVNEIAADLAISIAATGLLVSAWQWTAAALAPMIAVLARRVQRRAVLVWALGGAALAQLGGGLAPGVAVLLGTRLCFGAAVAAHAPTVAATSSLLVPPERRSSAVAAIMLGFALASIIGIPFGVWFGGQFGWRATMLLTGGLLMATLAWVRRVIPAELPLPTRRFAGYGEVLRHPGVLAAALVTLAQSGAQMIFFPYLAPQLRESLGAGPGLVALVLGWTGIFSLIGSLLGIGLIDRLGPARMIGIGAGMVVVGMLIWSGAQGSVTLTFLAAALWAAGSIMVFSANQAQMLMVSGRHAPVAIALTSTGNYSGGVVDARTGRADLGLRRGLPAGPAAGAAPAATGERRTTRRSVTR
jgi:predicted MFS family arabinose efflux permease